MGLVLLLLNTSLNPALSNDDGIPVQANAAGILLEYGSTGYASTILAPFSLQNLITFFNNSTDNPCLRNCFPMNKQLTDQTF